ncbi:MAG TPA: hypothetical protein VN848_04630 [Gemmatimonadales bacterium]|nr:hypothetical protein [Gemmatimonadales bacterium]
MRGLVLVLALAACATHAPSGPLPVRAYRVLIEGRDSLSEALARALVERGVAVERHVRGGGPRAAALVTFTFRDPAGPRLFGARLADTRSGQVVAAVSVPVDSLGNAAHAAGLLADSLLAQPAP